MLTFLKELRHFFDVIFLSDDEYLAKYPVFFPDEDLLKEGEWKKIDMQPVSLTYTGSGEWVKLDMEHESYKACIRELGKR
jgi:hypothetical protein